MSDNPVREVISDLFQHLEALETQCAALVRLLREKGLGTNEEFARCMQQASEASNIKWRAARLRMEHLFASIPEPSGKPAEATAKRTEAVKEDQSKRHSDEAEKDREEVKIVDSPAKQTAEQAHQDKPPEKASVGSGNEERPSQTFKGAVSQPPEKPPGEIRVGEKRASTTDTAEESSEKEKQGREKAA